MKKWVDLDFEIGTFVYLKTDEDQKNELSCGNMTSWHFDFEVSDVRDVVIKTSDR